MQFPILSPRGCHCHTRTQPKCADWRMEKSIVVVDVVEKRYTNLEIKLKTSNSVSIMHKWYVNSTSNHIGRVLSIHLTHPHFDPLLKKTELLFPDFNVVPFFLLNVYLARLAHGDSWLLFLFCFLLCCYCWHLLRIQFNKRMSKCLTKWSKKSFSTKLWNDHKNPNVYCIFQYK